MLLHRAINKINRFDTGCLISEAPLPIVAKMKLADHEKDVIAYLFFQSEAPVTEISKALKVPEHKVRYSVNKLREMGTIYSSPVVNPAALGLTEYQLFLSLVTPGDDARRELIQALTQNEKVAYVASIGGPFDLDVMVLVRNVYELANFFDELTEAAPEVNFEKTIAATISMTYFPPKYLSDCKHCEPFLTIGPATETHELDPTDHDILAALMSEEFSSQRQIAKELGVPSSTVGYRIDSLKEKGILCGVISQISPYQVGVTPFILLLELHRVTPEFRKRLLAFGTEHPNITFLIEDLGSWEYQVGVRLEDPRKISSLVQDFRKEFQNEIGNLTTVPVYEAIKLDSYPFKNY